MTTHHAASLTAAAVVLLAGCQLPSLNRSVSPGDELLPVFAEAIGQAPAPETAAGRVSLTNGHNRLQWRPVTIEVPTYQVEAQPIYNLAWPLYRDTPRQAGRFPTPDTALQYDATGTGHYGEGIACVAEEFGSLILMPVQIFLDPVWGAKRYPAMDYERVPPATPGEDLRRWFAPYDQDPSMSTGSEPPS